MKLELLELEERKAKFIVEGVHPYFVNALRRVLQAEVPKLAIDQVTFYDNTSALFDEIIAHRLALLPIPTDPSTLNRMGELDDDGNPAYLVRYTLTKEGPCTVYSGDFECEDEAFLPADRKIPIVELLEGQRLILEATAVLGQGTDHAKWQVAQAVGYKYFPTTVVDNKKFTPEQAKEAVANTPAGILGDGYQVTYDDRKFVFRFETDGSLKAEDALLKAVELLKERFKGFSDAVGEL